MESDQDQTGEMLDFALNQMTAPKLPLAEFFAMARRVGCSGVELRCDVNPGFFDTHSPQEIGAVAAAEGLRIHALAELYGFNDLTAERFDHARALMEMAAGCGARALILIPLNAGEMISHEQLEEALGRLAPELEAHGLDGLVEPLGFASSSLRDKAPLVDLLGSMSLTGRIKLLHDTFHHHLAGAGPVFGKQTGLVHISGVSRELPADKMTDGDRGLVTQVDRLGNLDQIAALTAGGYEGAFSFEAFSKEVHTLSDPSAALAASINLIATQLSAEAA